MEAPASKGYDFENDTHLHLSNLWGQYQGISLSSPAPPFLGGFANATIQRAVATELWSRGPGNGPDANAGWVKVWRVAWWGVRFVDKEGKVSKRYNSNSGVV